MIAASPEDQIARYADMLAALGTETRLRIVRLLLSAHPEGLVVGEIGSELSIPPSTLSHHLDKLKNEGLVSVRRESTFLRCTAKPTRLLLTQLLARADLTVRQILREKGTPFHDLGLGDPSHSDEALLDEIEARPILMNRPLVVTPKGVRLCRPSETVLDLLPPQRGEFIKEDGERVIDDHGRRVATA